MVTEPRTEAERMLSAAHERVVELEGRAFSAERSLEVAQARIAELEDEVACYREALERIALVPDGRYGGPSAQIARQALRGNE